MDDGWINAVLRPQLTGLDAREWGVGSIRDFVVGLHDQITRAGRDGALSKDEVRKARELVAAAMRTIPGITVVEHRSTFRTTRAARRPDSSE